MPHAPRIRAQSFTSRPLINCQSAKVVLRPERLELEITESVLLDRGKHTIETLNRLRQLGARISLDDFGVGYAGLGYIRDFRFDKLKIDRSFIKLLPTDQASAAIVRAAMGLAANLGMVTLGEGVENDVELSCLLSEGCREAQGFLFGKAKPADTVPDVVKAIETALAEQGIGAKWSRP